MHSEWRNFLLSQGAIIGAAEHRLTFPKQIPGEYHLADLSHQGLIAVSGADADKFLQGQCTNDLRQLTAHHSQLGSHCNPKGRMLALFRLIRRDAAIYLQLPVTTLPSLVERLNKYRLRAQLTINDATDQIVAIGLTGPGADRLLDSVLLTAGQVQQLAAAPPNTVIHIPPLSLIRLPGTTLRIQILGPMAQMPTLWTNLVTQGAVPMDTDAWTLLDIQAGIPTLHIENVEAFIPQMTNLQLLGGISFSKGCYTGQEVVARLQHLGTLKRRMFRAQVVTPNRPRPGDQLYSPSSDSEQWAGRVVDACPGTANNYELLVVVEIDAVQQGPIHLTGNTGPVLEFLTLPYE